MTPIKALAALLLPVLLSGPALADEARAVPSGVNQQIDFFASVNPDCSPAGMPTVRLLDGPSAGLITTDKARDFLAFPRGNVRHVCNRKRVAGVKLFYRSKPGYVGTDRVRILILSGSGTEREAIYAIGVR